MREIARKIIIAIILLIIFCAGLYWTFNGSGSYPNSNKMNKYIVITKDKNILKEYEGKYLGFDYYVIYSNHYPYDIDGIVRVPDRIKIQSFNLTYYQSQIETSYWYNLLKIDELHNKSKGDGIRIGIIDTGVDITHPYLKGYIYGGRSYITNEPYYVDDIGHGTMVAGIIRTIAPNSQIYVYKVFGSSDYTTEDLIMEAIADAVNDKMNIISLSLGSSTSIYSYDTLSQFVDKYAKLNTSLFVVSAGNEYSYNSITSPARAKYVISVGAIDSTDKLASFSSKGWGVNFSYKPNLVCYGVNIKSTAVPPLDGGFSDLDGTVNGLAIDSGTSFSAPMISGLSALVMSYWHINNISYLRSFMETHTTYINGYSPIEIGNGKPNPDSLLMFNETVDSPKSLGNLIDYDKPYYNFTIKTYNVSNELVSLINSNIPQIKYGFINNNTVYFNISLIGLTVNTYYAYFNIGHVQYSFVFTKQVNIRIVYNRMPFVVAIRKIGVSYNPQFFWGGKISLQYYEDYKLPDYGYYNVIAYFVNPNVIVEKTFNVSKNSTLFYLNDTFNQSFNFKFIGVLNFYNKTIYVDTGKLGYNISENVGNLSFYYLDENLTEHDVYFGLNQSYQLINKTIYVNSTFNLTIKYGYYREILYNITNKTILNISYNKFDFVIDNCSIGNFSELSYYNGTIFNNVSLNGTNLTIVKRFINESENISYNNETINVSNYTYYRDNHFSDISFFFDDIRQVNLNDVYRLYFTNHIYSNVSYSISIRHTPENNIYITKTYDYIEFKIIEKNISANMYYDLIVKENGIEYQILNFRIYHIAYGNAPYIEIIVNNENNSNKLIKGFSYLFSVSGYGNIYDITRYVWYFDDVKEYGTVINYSFNDVGRHLIRLYGFDYQGKLVAYTERYVDVYEKFIKSEKIVVNYGSTYINITVIFSKELPYQIYVVSYYKIEPRLYVGYKYIVKIDFSKVPDDVNVSLFITINGNIIYPDNGLFSENYITDGKKIISDWELKNSAVYINVHKHPIIYLKMHMNFYDRLYDGIKTLYYTYKGE